MSPVRSYEKAVKDQAGCGVAPVLFHFCFGDFKVRVEIPGWKAGMRLRVAVGIHARRQ
jgi:hypothetical protein